MWEFSVIGKGLIGSSAFKYLSKISNNVCIIGPDEPTDYKSWSGPYSSHFDEARITRISAPDKIWANLASQSIAEYANIEKESNIKFHFPNSHLRVATKEIIEKIRNISDECKTNYRILSSKDLSKNFPKFNFSSKEGLLELAPAGHINPRSLKKAQLCIGKSNNGIEINDIAVSISEKNNGLNISLASGEVVKTKKVIICTGSYSGFIGPKKLKDNLTPVFETTCLGEVSSKDVDLQKLPSLIYHREGSFDKYLYTLPACKYPNGKLFIKIGGPNDGNSPKSSEDIEDWFKDEGNNDVFYSLKESLIELFPSVKFNSFKSNPCILTYTRSGNPIIDEIVQNKIYSATGGNGGAAKSSDAIGRIAAGLVSGENFGDGIDISKFRA